MMKLLRDGTLRLGIRLVALAGLPGCTPEWPADALLIEHASITSAERESPWRDASVLVVDGRIAWIGGGVPSRRRAEWSVLDAEGRYLTPGLIDGHVHVGHPIALTDEQFEEHPDLVASYRGQLPRSYLYFGFTTLVDLDLRDDVRQWFGAPPDAPTLHGCGRGIRLEGGYGPALFPATVRERIFPVQVEEGTDTASERSPEAVVTALAAGGAKCIKTYHESGFGGVFDWPVPSDTLLRRLADAAHARRLPMVLHATGLDGHRAGVTAGVDILAHGLWHWPGPRLDSVPPAAVDTLLRDLAARRIAVMPTARVIEGEADTWYWSLLDHPQLSDALTPDWIDWLRSDEGRWPQRDLRDLYAEHLPDDGADPEQYLETSRARVRTLLSRYRAADIPLLFGSDTPASEGIGNPPGLNGRLEIAAWAAAGIPAAEIFDALTRRTAEAFGLDAEIGTVAVGKRADLLLLDRDPTIDPTAYDAIHTVIVDGRPIRRETLSAKRWSGPDR